MYVLDVMYELSIHLFKVEFACDDIYVPKDRMKADCSMRCFL